MVCAADSERYRGADSTLHPCGLPTTKEASMKENSETVKMTGTVSNDCRPIALNLRATLKSTIALLYAYRKGECTEADDRDKVIRDAENQLANSEHL